MGVRVWTDDVLDGLRLVGDPYADGLVARYFEGQSSPAPRHLIHHLVATEHLAPEHRSLEIEEYLHADPPLPDWVDEGSLRRGEEFFLQWGLLIGMLHYYASLPSAYAMARGVPVLHLTARLASDTRRRIHETAQMIIHAMTPGGLAVGAPGYRDARRVRLMHSAVRHLILHDPSVARTCDPTAVGPRWCDEWGLPLNQEDMLATLLTFTEVVFAGLRRAGVRVSDEEAAGYLHRWCVAGHLVGIRHDLLPLGLDEASALWSTIRRRQYGPSPEGEEMTAALLRLLQARSPQRFHDLPVAQMRYFLGNDVADMLGVGPARSMAHLFGTLRRVTALAALTEQHNRLVRMLARHVGRALLQGMLESGRAGDRAAFAIPTNLVRRWKLPPDAPVTTPS
jgi:hypothetical protein